MRSTILKIFDVCSIAFMCAIVLIGLVVGKVVMIATGFLGVCLGIRALLLDCTVADQNLSQRYILASMQSILDDPTAPHNRLLREAAVKAKDFGRTAAKEMAGE